MRFRNDDFQPNRKDELADTVESEHPQRLAAVAEEQIKAMHHHGDGSTVELHEVGAREFIQQSIGSSLEGKITGSSFDNSEENQQRLQNMQNAPKIEYEKKSSQNQPTQLYGSQQSVTGGVSHKQETLMMGCNCGAEWTVTGQSTKAAESGPGGIKVEQYGSAAGKGAAGYNTSGSGPGEYRAGGGQRQEYRG